MVGSDELATHYPRIVLHRVGVATGGGGAVMEEKRPGEGRGRKRDVLVVGGGAGEVDHVVDTPRGKGVGIADGGHRRGVGDGSGGLVGGWANVARGVLSGDLVVVGGRGKAGVAVAGGARLADLVGNGRGE